MNGAQLTDRYLKGRPLSRDERSALAKQVGGAVAAMKAISMAKAKAAEACRDWQPVNPTVGEVAYCYVKYKRVWRVIRDGQIVKAYERENDAKEDGIKLADEVNAKWRGRIADPTAKTA
jgi:hypothetical protein